MNRHRKFIYLVIVWGLKATETALAYVPTRRVANASNTTVQVLRLPCLKGKHGSSPLAHYEMIC